MKIVIDIDFPKRKYSFYVHNTPEVVETPEVETVAAIEPEKVPGHLTHAGGSFDVAPVFGYYFEPEEDPYGKKAQATL